MGIRKVHVYIVKCDICGRILENGEGGDLCLPTKKVANEHVPLSAWKKKDGKLACYDCLEQL